MNKLKSITNKFKSGAKSGLKKTELARQMGKYFCENPNPEIERIAKKRYQKCKDLVIDEPVEFLKIEDKHVPEWSGKIFKDCGCPISYKLRQTIINCKCWL